MKVKLNNTVNIELTANESRKLASILRFSGTLPRHAIENNYEFTQDEVEVVSQSLLDALDEAGVGGR